MKQTFLTAAQVDELVAMYEDGVAIGGIAERFSVHPTTVVAHLKRRSVPMHRRGVGLAEAQYPEVAALYKEGFTLDEIGRRFRVGNKAVRRAVVATGGTIRKPGRQRAVGGGGG